MATEAQVKKFVESQRSRMSLFDDFKKNYRKANRIEKAKIEFHEKRLKRLGEWWVEFDKTNSDLELYAEKDDEYFLENDYEHYSKEYEKMKTVLEDAIVRLKTENENHELKKKMIQRPRKWKNQTQMSLETV